MCDPPNHPPPDTLAALNSLEPLRAPNSCFSLTFCFQLALNLLGCVRQACALHTACPPSNIAGLKLRVQLLVGLESPCPFLRTQQLVLVEHRRVPCPLILIALVCRFSRVTILWAGTLSIAHVNPTFVFDELVVTHYCGSAGGLTGLVVTALTQQAVAQGYKVVGSMELLGDPLSLVGKVGVCCCRWLLLSSLRSVLNCCC